MSESHLYRVRSNVPLTIYNSWGDKTNAKGQTTFFKPSDNRYWEANNRVGSWYFLEAYMGWVNLEEAPPGSTEVLPPKNPDTRSAKIIYNIQKKHEIINNEKYDKMNSHIGMTGVDDNARLFFNDAQSADDGVMDLGEYDMDGEPNSWHEAMYNDYGTGNGMLWTAASYSNYQYNNPSLYDLSLGQSTASPFSAERSGPNYSFTDVGTTSRSNIPQGGKSSIPTHNMNKAYRPNVKQGVGANIPSHNLNTVSIKLKPRPDNEGSVYQPYFDQRFGSSQFIENITTPSLSTPNDYASFGQAIQTIKHNLNIFDNGDIKQVFSKFNRHRLPIPDQHLPRTVPYIFMTRPNITFLKSANKLEDQFYKDSLFNTVFEKNPEVIHNLELKYNPDHQFNTLLGSMTRSFEVSDEVIKTVDDGETYTGWKMVYGRNTNESNTASQIGIQYTDDAQLRIYYIHKLWLEYINKVYRGEFSPKLEMILDKIIDYSVAIYYIVCAADGETILYWSKYYGIFPINTPGSKHSWTHGNPQVNQEFTVNYAYSLKVEMEPSILAEFNTHSKLPFKYRKIYDPRIQTNTPTFVNAPFVEKSFDPTGRAVYKLRYRN